MSRKNFRATGGIDIDSNAIPTTVIQETITSNSAVTVDTIALDSFISSEYTITLKQGSKIRTSKVIMQTDGTSVDMTEFAITETGGTISGVVVSATTSSTNAVLQITVTDAATTLVRYKLIRNISTTIQYVPDAPTIGTATAGVQQASVTFTEPTDNGGASITNYTVTSSPENITAFDSSSPITVTNLTAGTVYTFTVTATNSIGTSVASSASNEVTPTEPPVKAGYFGGGNFGGSSGDKTSTVNKLLFSTESWSTLAQGLSSGRGFLAAMANSGTAGYFAGGDTGSGAVTTVDKFSFPSDSQSTLASGLNEGTTFLAGMANSGTAGYFGGGVARNTLYKYTFSNDTKSSSSMPGRPDGASWVGQLAGMANSGTAGYFGGGFTHFANTDTVYKHNFSNDSQSFTTTLGAARTALAGMANSGTAGYFGGGSFDGTLQNTIYKFSFPSDSRSTLGSTLSTPTAYLAANAESGVAGYFGGGTSSGSSWGTKVEKLTFSNDSMSVLSQGLSLGVNFNAGMANSGTL